MDFVANFNLTKNEIEADFEVNQPAEFDAVLEINPAVANWGNITGNLADQTDLKNALDAKADIQEVNTKIQNEATTRAENDSLLQGNINTLNTNLTSEINNRTSADSNLQSQITQNATDINLLKTTILDYGDIVTYDAADFATAAQGQKADSALQPNDNITLLNNNAGFITNAVNDLVNYYKKSETYTKTEVQALIASIPQFRVVVVQALPVTGERMILYLVPKDGEAPDVYNEYIWVEDEDEFELLGSTAVDLTGYAKESWVLNQDYATETYVDNGLATKQNVLTAGNNITISGDTISATDTTYTAGTDIEIVNTPSTSATVTGTDSIALNNAEANTLQNVTVSGVTEQVISAEGYTQLQYIEDFDDTYIDLEMHLKTAIHSVELKVSTDSLTNNNFFGARNSTTVSAYTLGVYYNKWRVGWGTSTTYGEVDTNAHILKLNSSDGTFYVDNELVATLGAITFETPKNAFLGGVYAQTGGIYDGSCKIYYLKLWQNDTLIKHLIPARRNTDNIIGMYDIVNDRFFTNSGTGDFVGGSDILIPNPYFPMDIASNNGILKVNSQGEVYADGTAETITDSLSNTATAEMLFNVTLTNDYTDTQEILTGAVTRNTAIKVLNGTENWIINSGDYNFYRLNSAVNYSGNLSSGFYCTHFKPASVASTTNNQGIRLNGNAIFLRYDDLYPANSTNLSLFKQWLADQYANGTPVILVYPITTATTETVTGQTLNVQNGDNTLTATGTLTNLPISAIYTAKEINTINFTNDTGYITDIDSTDVVDALGYTPVNPSNLATVATSGSYNDLSNKPTIPSAQVNSDWNALSGVAEILNKPNLATVATSGSYNDLSNKPTIPSEVTESTVAGWGFTKNEGTVTSVNNTQPDASGNVEFIPPIAYATSTTAAATVQKEVSIPEITELNVGQIIVVQPTITSTVANSTLKLNNFDAYPMRYTNSAITTSTDSTVWSLNYPSQFVFDGTYWVFLGHGTDTNTTYTINYSIDAGAYKAGVGNYAITRYSLCMQKPDMTWEKVTATSATYSTATSKSVNTNGFILGNIRYYNTTAIVANGANTASNTMNEKAATLDLRYSTNCGTPSGWSTGDYIYFVGTIGVDGLFYLDTTTWWTNTLPSTNDGKLYVQLGKFLADYNISLYENHPAYYYNGSKLCEYKVADNKQDTLISGTNIKTINNESILGSGNITIQGGGSVDSVNGQTGTVVLDASDVGALPDTTTIPTKTSDLTNDSGFITGITSSDVTTALGYTPYNSSNPNGYTSNVGTVTSVNNTQPVNGNVTISIPDTSTLANKDLSNLSTTGNAKFQAPLVSGTSIKTVNNTSLLGSGNIDTTEVFIATYGTTSYTDILNAYNAGKEIICNYTSETTIYELRISHKTSSYFYFSNVLNSSYQYYRTYVYLLGWGAVTTHKPLSSVSYDSATQTLTIA